MKFWEIDEPFGSDYRHVQVSGKLEHPYRLPMADCEKCGASVSCYYDVVLPFECPASFRKNRLLTDEDARVTVKDFKKLAKAIASELPKSATSRLAPQACFQPGFLDVPSTPKDDFLWSDLWSGLSSKVVSERVQRAIEKVSITGIEFYPVTPRRIGKRSPKTTPRIPASGEPEDMMNDFKGAKNLPSMPPYYQLLVSAEADYPSGAEPHSMCDLCGEEKDANWKAKDTAWKNLTPELIASLSKGLNLFRIPQRGTVFVTDTLKEALEQLGATNVCFKPFPPEPIATPKRKSSTLR
jgi:hypothetical protein